MSLKKRTSKTPRRSGLVIFTRLIIFPLILLDSYALWRLNQEAGHWRFTLIPSSIPETLTHLAVILALNVAVIVILLFYIKKKT